MIVAATPTADPAPGFTDPVHESQRVFRAVLDAMARPGKIVPLTEPVAAPRPLFPTAYAVCLALVDFETPLWLDAAASDGPARESLRFHCGCPLVDRPEDAGFALIVDAPAMPSLPSFAIGDDAYPDRSATLIVQVERLSADAGRTLAGPGIASTVRLDVSPLGGDFWDAWRRNHALYPLGVDVIFAAPDAIAGLPRSVMLKEE